MNVIEKLYMKKLYTEALAGEKFEKERQEEARKKKEEEDHKRFFDSLSKEQKAAFQEMEDWIWERAALEEDNVYLRGFKTGALVMLEVFNED